MSSGLKTRDLTIGYRRAGKILKAVGRDLNLFLKSGELVALLGPNGSGKSTLLRTLARLQKPLSGTISLFDKPINQISAAELSRIISVVLTGKPAVNFMSVYKMVSLGRIPYTGRWGGLDSTDKREIEWSLKAMNVWQFRNRQLDELSDGEKQKVMISRALAQKPRIMILDEPTAFLDINHKHETLRLLRDLAFDQKITILLSSHDFDIVTRIADRIWMMNRNGTIQSGAPEDLFLSGGFESVFGKKGFRFDPKTGTFIFETARCGKVRLTGDETGRYWTERALQRSGFQIVVEPDEAEIRIEVGQKGTLFSWQVKTTTHQGEFDSIYRLLEFLTEKLKTPAV